MDKNGQINVLNQAIRRNKIKVVRIHSSGDFYNQTYFESLVESAKQNPNVIYFGYTKILKYAELSQNVDNLYLIYSVGGKDDQNCQNSNVAKSIVCISHNSDAVCQNKDVFSQGEDFLKILLNQNVYLNLHGTQPKSE